MNKTLFTENLQKNQLLVTRTFNSQLSLVWDSWTNSDLLTKWWSSEGFKCVTKSMDFREGGDWLYYMEEVSTGNRHWGKINYLKIILKKSFEATHSFCDEQGLINPDIPSAHWDIQFNKVPNGTEVWAMHTFNSAKEMRTYIEMGAKEGTQVAYGLLDQLFIELIEAGTNK